MPFESGWSASPAGAPFVDPAAVEPWGLLAAYRVGSSTAQGLPPAQSALESQSEGRNDEMLEPAMFLGLGAVALRACVKHPRLRSSSLTRAVAHVIVAFTTLRSCPRYLASCRFSRRAPPSPTS